jgi:hypothetical protein
MTVTKPKTKLSHWDVVCAEVSPGKWEWTTGKLRWQWQNGYGINLYIYHSDESTPLVHSKDIHEAVMFSLGYEQGRLSAGGADDAQNR